MVGGIGGIGCSQSQMKQLMADRFQNADADGNGSVTKDELTQALANEGRDASHVDRIFERVDTDGNGEISQAEHDSAVEARMNKMPPPGPRGGMKPPSMETDQLATLLENLAANTEDEEISAQLQELLAQLESGEQGTPEIFRQTVSVITGYSPPGDVKA